MKISNSLARSGTESKRKFNSKGIESRERLLQSAKMLFAEKGFREVSVREITAHAGVNSALVGYYYGNKQSLFNEVYRSYEEPLAGERIRMLKALRKSRRKPSVEDILKAWLFPWLQAKSDPVESALHVRFTANLSAERWKNNKKAARFTQQANNAFIEALHDCLPHLSRKTLIWRLHFIMGAIAFGIRVPDPLRALLKGRCDPADLETTLDQILSFAVGGLKSPEPE